MSPLDLFRKGMPDCATLVRQQDISGLIGVLGSKDPEIQNAAISALAQIGPAAAEPMIAALKTRNRTLRLGLISALAEIRDPRALHALEGMTRDESSEIRWQAAIALGEMGDIAASGTLLSSLRDRDKYVRYASAISLLKTGYRPGSDDEWAWYFAGMQAWEKLIDLQAAAIPPLVHLLSDSDNTVRKNAVRTLGAVGSREAGTALLGALRDEDRQVRWEAVLASQKCGVPAMQLPRGICHRPRQRKNPLVAGFLNFLLPGLGYGYLGKWWGIMIFQIELTVTIQLLNWFYKNTGDMPTAEANTWSILLPFYLLLGVHAWYITKMMPEEPL